MGWVVLSYSLPTKIPSSVRVSLWRRLRRLGAIAPKSGIHVLPARDECFEAFQWLTQEVQQAKGEALIMHVERFEGLADSQLVELFHAACKEEYEEIVAEAEALERAISSKTKSEEHRQIRDGLAKLQKRYADIARVDFFNSPAGAQLASQLARLEQALSPKDAAVEHLAPAEIAEYQNKRWVTRPRPHVDRLACIWLIRRFIDPNATVRYAHQPQADEIAFDMSKSEFGHQGNLCTFETMVARFGLDHQPGLRVMGEIIHEIDLRDSKYLRPETSGIDVVLRGWLLAGLPDQELESCGVELFEGLYVVLSHQEKR